MEESKHETLTDETPIPASSAAGTYPWLVYLGSPENNFLEAGKVIDLTGIRAVRFGRGGGQEIRAERSNNVLRLRVPLGWVSSVHAELRIAQTSLRHEFELRDLGSRNGTHVEREVIDETMGVAAGQVIEIGRSFWLVRTASSRSDGAAHEFSGLRTSSPKFLEMTKRLERLARSNIPLLFTGETGAGKEYLARAVHRLSERRGEFVKINLSALPEEHVDSVLFGTHDAPDAGVFHRAHNGTLFLDELDALTPAQQNKLNAALANLGTANEHRPGMPTRIIGASHQDLHKQVSQHLFRGDLYSKISGYLARVPPLRERREDLGLLCARFLGIENQAGRSDAHLVTRAFRRLLIHPWPFNVRELHQTLSTAKVLSSAGGSITLDMIEEIMSRHEDLPQHPDSVETLRQELVRGLVEHHGNVNQVARQMHRDIAEVIRLVERFGLQAESFSQNNVTETIADFD